MQTANMVHETSEYRQCETGLESIFSASATNTHRLHIQWARHQDDIKAAQRLRFNVFHKVLDVRSATLQAGHDTDLFDNYCEHLIIREGTGFEIVATCRVLTPVQAKRIGSTAIDTEFDLTRLRALRGGMVELGRVCVHPDYRDGEVIRTLLRALFEFVQRNQFHTIVGCASVPMSRAGVSRCDAVANIWQQLRADHLAPIELHVHPRSPLFMAQMKPDLNVELPALVKALVRMGAKVMGAPTWNADFNAADIPMLLRMTDMPSRHRKHLLGA